MSFEEGEAQRAAARAALTGVPNYELPAPPAPAPGPALEQRNTEVAGPGSAQRIMPGRQATTSLAGLNRDPNSGRYSLGLQTPEGPRNIVLSDRPQDWAAQITQAGISDPNAVAADAISRLRADPEPAPTQRQGTGRVQSVMSATTQAPVTQATRDAAAAARVGMEDATAQARADQIHLAQLRADGMTRMAAQQEEGARIEDQEVAERQAQMRARTQRMDDTIERVQNNRIDPEAFFGRDFGHRLGAGVLVALGNIGQALGGGENQALALINQGIERNMRAQEANQANLRAGAGMEGQALGQFRAMLGDEEAAREASRAAHLAAAGSQVRALMANAQPQQLQGLHRLQDALRAAQQAAQAAANDRARWTMERRTAVDQRTSMSGASRAALGIQRDTMTSEEREEYETAITRQRALSATMRGGGAGASRIRRRSRRARSRADQVARISAEDIEEAREGIRDREETASSVATPDFGSLGIFEMDPERWRGVQPEEGTIRMIVERSSAVSNINRVLDRIEHWRRNRSDWSALTDADRNAELSEMREQLRNNIRIARGFGVVSGTGEIAAIQEATGDPTGTQFLDTLMRRGTGARLREMRRGFNAEAESLLRPFGLRLRTRSNQLQGGRGNVPVSETPVPERLAPTEERGIPESTTPGTPGNTGSRISQDDISDIRALAESIVGMFTDS